jgi:hypothetical protein
VKRKREPIVSNPTNFPVEIAQLFERAAYGPVRMPTTGGFDTFNAANSAKLNIAKWKAQFKRSRECPEAFRKLIETIQFPAPVQEGDSWCFYITPFAGKTMELVKEVIGTSAVPADEFWKTYTQEGSL